MRRSQSRAAVAQDETSSPPRSIGQVRRLERRAVPAITVAKVERYDEETGAVTLDVNGEEVLAALDPSVDPAVIRTAVLRRERVIVADEGGWVVLGALRTAATPGVDEGEEFMIKARRVAIVAAHEFHVVSGAAALALRAVGHVETIAQDITTRASSVHKIIGRMIRLN